MYFRISLVNLVESVSSVLAIQLDALFSIFIYYITNYLVSRHDNSENRLKDLESYNMRIIVFIDQPIIQLYVMLWNVQST